MPSEPSATYPCPACGFVVFDEPPGSYSICPVCNWEDDHVQLAYPRMDGGANHESLVDWQVRALKETPLDLRDISGRRRAPYWRPLEPRDLTRCQASEPPTDGMSYFRAAGGDSPTPYWVQRPARSVEAITEEVDHRAPIEPTLRLWIPEHLALGGNRVDPDVAMAVIMDRVLSHGLFPAGLEEHPGGRVYLYQRGAG